MTHWRTIALGAVLASRLAAQPATQAPTHVVSGLVYDSLAHTPLAGAVVQIALAGAVPRVFTAIADESGHYRVGGLPAGRFAIVFQHDALNALGLESPLFAIELGVDTAVTVHLGIPPGDVVRAQRCSGLAAGAGDGMIAGYVFDARRETTLGGADVEVRWSEVTFQKAGLRQEQKRVHATVAEDGTYIACGVASDAPVDVRVTRSGYREIVAPVTVPAAGATRQDFRLADSGAVRGAASLAGRVVQEDGKPVPAGRASIAALAVDVAVTNGEFAMTGLPAGTWLVDARAIGYDRRSLLVHTADRSSTAVTLRLEKQVQTLEVVSVIGRVGRDTRTLLDITERNRTSGGTVFLPGSDWLETADSPADVLRGARGFVQKSQFRAEARMYLAGGFQNLPCVTTEAPRGMGTGKAIALYLDGARFPGGLSDLSSMVAMKDILAIEAYPDVLSVPLLWRTSDACAVVAIWTRH